MENCADTKIQITKKGEKQPRSHRGQVYDMNELNSECDQAGISYLALTIFSLHCKNNILVSHV